MENLTVTDTRLFEVFREAFGKRKAEESVNAIKNTARSEMENQTQVLATKDQLAATREQISALEVRLVDRIHKAQFQIIFWVVSIGVLQFVASYLLRG